MIKHLSILYLLFIIAGCASRKQAVYLPEIADTDRQENEYYNNSSLQDTEAYYNFHFRMYEIEICHCMPLFFPRDSSSQRGSPYQPLKDGYTRDTIWYPNPVQTSTGEWKRRPEWIIERIDTGSIHPGSINMDSLFELNDEPGDTLTQ